MAFISVILLTFSLSSLETGYFCDTVVTGTDYFNFKKKKLLSLPASQKLFI
jgi:hypothetical protein